MTIDSTVEWPPAPSVGRLVTPNVTHLLAPNASSWTYEGTNSWIIAAGDESIIVDPGIENAAHLEALRRQGTVDGRTVSAVLLTHDHPDHSDGVRTLADSLGTRVIGMSPRFADDLLKEGDVLTVGGLPVSVLHTPGHSDDSICLWVPSDTGSERGALLTGDTVLGGRSSGVMGKLGDLLASLQRLREFAGDHETTGLPGHGPIVTALAGEASVVIDVRSRRIDQVREFIADGDTTVLELIQRLYPQLRGSRSMFAASTVISTIDYLIGLDGEKGIADAAQRADITADVDKYKQAMAARTRETRTR